METRVSLDVSTMGDPIIRDLLAESDMFVTSFQSAGVGFGLLSPFDFLRVFTIVSEILSNLFVLFSLVKTQAGARTDTVTLFTFAFSVISFAYPYVRGYILPYRHWFDMPAVGEEEAHHADIQERMRHLSTSESHRPEVMLFGLGPWILDSWANARRASLGLRSHSRSRTRTRILSDLLSHIKGTEVMSSLQNVSNMLSFSCSSFIHREACVRSDPRASHAPIVVVARLRESVS